MLRSTTHAYTKCTVRTSMARASAARVKAVSYRGLVEVYLVCANQYLQSESEHLQDTRVAVHGLGVKSYKVRLDISGKAVA